jgi:hypothetical protein
MGCSNSTKIWGIKEVKNIEKRQAANQERENDNDQVSSEPKQLVGIKTE